MNRTDLEALAYLRVAEADVLLAADQPSGAYYLAGYAVECALKACIAVKTELHDFPDRKRVNESHTHNLQNLLVLAELEEQWRDRCRSHPDFDTNWKIVRTWSESRRYLTTEAEDARLLLAAIKDPSNGVLPWLAKHW